MFFGRDVIADVRNRLKWYRHDWVEGINCHVRILAPALLTFFTSLIPALAFGERLSHGTDGLLNGVQIIASTAIAGAVQAVLGGQPLLIYGVGAPILLLYVFLYDFATPRGIPYLPWVGWVCVWTGVFVMLLALLGTVKWVMKITRFSAELFEILIAFIFAQEGILGLVHEFQSGGAPHGRRRLLGGSSDDADSQAWLLVNGNFGLVLAFGFLLTSLLTHKARGWILFRGFIRNFIADFGVPAMVVIWTGVSYVYSGLPSNVPRRLDMTNTWETSNWTVAAHMFHMEAMHIVIAAVPGAIVAMLFYFDHNLPALLSQRPEFNLQKPTAYHWDFFLVGVMTIVCGLLGIPPSTALIPNSPLHVKSLASLRSQLTAAKLKKAQRSITAQPQEAQPPAVASDDAVVTEAPPLGQRPSVVSRMMSAKDVLAELESKYTGEKVDPSVLKAIQHSLSATAEGGEGGAGKEAAFDYGTHLAPYIPLEVKEQRVSNLIQSLLMGVCLAATPLLKKVPSAILWGYFIYMALESLPGNQFWERLTLLLTDPKRRNRLLAKSHVAFLETVPFKVTLAFTLLQLVYMLGVWALITFAGVGGIGFPLPIMLLLPLRLYAMPRVFGAQYLEELDALDYEEAPPVVPEEGNAEDGGGREVVEGEMRQYQVVHHLSRATLRQRLTRMAGCASGVTGNSNGSQAAQVGGEAGGSCGAAGSVSAAPECEDSASWLERGKLAKEMRSMMAGGNSRGKGRQQNAAGRLASLFETEKGAGGEGEAKGKDEVQLTGVQVVPAAVEDAAPGATPAEQGPASSGANGGGAGQGRRLRRCTNSSGSLSEEDTAGVLERRRLAAALRSLRAQAGPSSTPSPTAPFTPGQAVEDAELAADEAQHEADLAAGHDRQGAGPSCRTGEEGA